MYNDYGLISPNPAVEESWLTGLGAAAIIGIVILALIVLAIVILMLVANCKMFKKAGQAWWKGLIPLYCSWVETKITGLAWWWFLIFAVLTATTLAGRNDNYIIYWALLLTSFNYNFNLAKKFGKTNGFAVLTTILPFIGIPILAFGSAQYNEAAEVDENGIFSVKK